MQNSRFSDFTICSIEWGRKVRKRPFSSPRLTNSASSLRLSFVVLLLFKRINKKLIYKSLWQQVRKLPHSLYSTFAELVSVPFRFQILTISDHIALDSTLPWPLNGLELMRSSMVWVRFRFGNKFGQSAVQWKINSFRNFLTNFVLLPC